MVSLSFTDEQLVLLDKALGALPYREAAPIIAAINEQIVAQREPVIDRTPTVMDHHYPTDPAALDRAAQTAR